MSVEPPSGEEIHSNDWQCRDCGIWYGADEDASSADLPGFCPECGDTPGWINVKTGRQVP